MTSCVHAHSLLKDDICISDCFLLPLTRRGLVSLDVHILIGQFQQYGRRGDLRTDIERDGLGNIC